MQLKDRVVVITGSGSGIGEACAKRFAAEGAKVVVTDVNAAGVDRVAGEVGTVGFTTDITVEANVQALAEFARNNFGEIDIWFSNAGVNGKSQRGVIPENFEWELGWDLHVMSHVYAARAVLPSMLERGDGYLLQTASVIAFAMQFDKGAYTASKHAALALSEWLAATYRPKGVKVSCFCPGAMLTPMLASNDFPPDSPVLKNAQTPEQVAERLVRGIEAENFLILDSDIAMQSMTMKLNDYDAFLARMSQT